MLALLLAASAGERAQINAANGVRSVKNFPLRRKTALSLPKIQERAHTSGLMDVANSMRRDSKTDKQDSSEGSARSQRTNSSSQL
jgi:hypothetical protein